MVLSCNVNLQSVSRCGTMRCTGAVCRCVLQHWSVVKLVVLHRVVGEQAPAHTQGRLGGRVGHLGVDYWGRWSCFYVGQTLLTQFCYQIIPSKALRKQEQLEVIRYDSLFYFKLNTDTFVLLFIRIRICKTVTLKLNLPFAIS